MEWIKDLKYFLGWHRLPLFSRLGYLMIKNTLLCRLSTGAKLCSVYGRLFSVWRTTICFWRCLYDWRTHREILLSNMGGNIISTFVHRHFRSRYIILMFESFIYFRRLDYAMDACIQAITMPKRLTSDGRVFRTADGRGGHHE
jgi:hypothetical protein